VYGSCDDPKEVLPYRPNEWNTVRVVLDFESRSYTLTVNGASSAPIPFLHPELDIRSVLVRGQNVCGRGPYGLASLDAANVCP
jgi:hypothetical protein